MYKSHFRVENNAPRSLGCRTCCCLGLASRRCGSSVLELIVAGSLLVVSVSIVGLGTVSSKRMQQDGRHYRLVVDELSNQMEHLLALSSVQRQAAIMALEPSEFVDALPGVNLAAELIRDEHGSRLKLSIDWQRIGEAPPVELVGWLDSLPTPTAEGAMP